VTRGSKPLEGEVLGPEKPHEREVRERLAFVAWLLDSSIPLPGTRLTVGLDAIVGLLPFIGDLVGVLASSYILAEAQRLGVGRAVLARMALNVAVEGLVGLVPLAGDLFDAGWKANQRNVRLLNAWLESRKKTERASGFLVVAVLGGVLALAVLSICLTFAALRWLVGAAT